MALDVDDRWGGSRRLEPVEVDRARVGPLSVIAVGGPHRNSPGPDSGSFRLRQALSAYRLCLTTYGDGGTWCYLGRFRTDRSHDLLVHLLATDSAVTQAAMTALARMKRPEDIEILRPYLDDPRDLIRRDATRAITKLEKATAK